MNSEQHKAILALNTCKGQIDGIIKMIKEGRYCIDVSNQLFAAEAMVKKANQLILSQHIAHCVKDALDDPENTEVKLKEVTNIINKLLK